MRGDKAGSSCTPLLMRANSSLQRKRAHRKVTEGDILVFSLGRAAWILEGSETVRHAKRVLLELKPNLVTFLPTPADIHPLWERSTTVNHFPIGLPGIHPLCERRTAKSHFPILRDLL